uniref:ATP synthase complex subunit 8 n=1 Tax=Serritermes serrifer TaxID=119666 RepID=A0A0A7E861_9NEOP|nr:ATP synthase F0 subunit 8 [Serritermes serrifer]
MPQMMPLEWTTLYMLFMATLLMFNIMNYYTKMPKKTFTKCTMIVKSTNWKW